MLRDSLMKLRMKLTPPSSRSFHDRTDEMMSKLWSIEAKLDRGLLEANQKIHSVSEDLAAFNEHSRLRWEELYRKPGETPEAMKRRFFSSIPPASGELRSFQLANARLMHDLDAICRDNDIDYWMCFGSLVATVSRAGFIPWDDDVDICMLKEDVEKLHCILKDDQKYQLTLAYDANVLCTQYRFSLKDRRVLCFVDICVWEWAADYSKDHDDRLRELRLSLMDEFHHDEALMAEWSKYSILYAPGSGTVVQYGGLSTPQPDPGITVDLVKRIDDVFERYRDIAYDEGILCDSKAATGLAYGMTNIYDAPWRRTIFPRDMILPTKRLPFEGSEVGVPNDYESVCDECYPGWPYLPKDILGHDHLPKKLLGDPDTIRASSFYAETGNLPE